MRAEAAPVKPSNSNSSHFWHMSPGMMERVVQLSGAWGPVAIGVICLLVFVEEVGVPLPMFPGDGLLLAAGVMIAAGHASPWLFFPLAYASAVAGATLGYTWARWLGHERLERLADRLRLRRHLDGATERLRRTGVAGVVVGRLLPGTRVYTSLVAGAAGVRRPTFLLGLGASTAVWLGLFTGLGIAIGVPAAHYLHQIQLLGGRLLLVAALLGATLAALGLLRPPSGLREAAPGRVALAVALDVALVAALALTVSETVLDDQIGLVIAAGLVLLAYTVGSRLAFGSTAGERLGRVSYRDLLPALG